MSHIKAGQVYRSASPRESISLRIERYHPGDVRAHVTDIDGKRFRQIKVSSLHAEPLKANGEARRTGYVLVRDA